MKGNTRWIVDSGATKSAWWQILAGRPPLHLGNTPGINPSYQTVAEITSQQADFLRITVEKHGLPAEIYFYGAGCATETGRQLVTEVLREQLPQVKLHIAHDLLAAARATCGRQAGRVAILGTGSNTCVYDGERIVEQLPSLGYLLGDLGGGFDLGRSLLRAYFGRQLPTPAEQQVRAALPDTHAALLEKCYKIPKPNAYVASFAPILHEHRAAKWAQTIIHGCFEDFLRYQVLPLTNTEQLPLHFVGSIAAHFRTELAKVCAKQSIRLGSVLAAPGEALAAYHQAS